MHEFAFSRIRAAFFAALALVAIDTAAVAQCDCDCKAHMIVDTDCSLTADCEANKVTIRSGGILRTNGHTLTITNPGGLTIDAFGKLRIEASGEVKLTGGGTHDIDGSLVLVSSTSELKILTNDATLSGAGRLDGLNDGATIKIGSGKTLTSEITIKGSLQITDETSSGTFVNGSDGLLHADRAGTLEINPTTLGAGAGDWKVSVHSSAVLLFSAGSTALTGDFTVEQGTLDIDADVTTTGDLDFSGGEIDVGNVSFKFRVNP